MLFMFSDDGDYVYGDTIEKEPLVNLFTDN